MDGFTCPECGEFHSIEDTELYEVYDEDGKVTEVDCRKCSAHLIITSEVTGWHFDVDVNQ